MNTSRLETHFPIQRSVFRIRTCLLIAILLAVPPAHALASERMRQNTFRAAIVVDERLSVLRSAPDLSAPLLRRIGRGRKLSVVGAHHSRAGIMFYRVAVTRRTRGWIQREALIVPRQRGEDKRLLRLIQASSDFDRLARARIFLDAFPQSALRPAVLLLFGDEASRAARKLSHDASRRLDPEEMKATGASVSAYFLNYNGLDRYRRLGIVFSFDSSTKQFHYDGASWHELIRRYRMSAEAEEARGRENSKQ